MSKYADLIVRLKSGEYDGCDIMSAWCAIRTLEAKVQMLTEKLKAADFELGGRADFDVEEDH